MTVSEQVGLCQSEVRCWATIQIFVSVKIPNRLHAIKCLRKHKDCNSSFCSALCVIPLLIPSSTFNFSLPQLWTAETCAPFNFYTPAGKMQCTLSNPSDVTVIIQLNRQLRFSVINIVFNLFTASSCHVRDRHVQSDGIYCYIILDPWWVMDPWILWL